MNCPACGAVLLSDRRGLFEDIEIDVCPACGGMWLDQGELNRLDDSVRSNAELRPMRPIDVAHPLKCPRCDLTGYRDHEAHDLLSLAFEDGENVVIHRCERCRGMWLGAGELDRIRSLILHLDSSETADATLWVKPQHK